MKHLITTDTGGFPFDLDDYRFMEAGFNEDIVSILKSYKYTPQSHGTPPPYSFIIFGCEMTDVGGGFTWTGGAVLIGGIIYRVEPNITPVLTTVGNAFYFSPAIATDPAGYENFKDGTPHNTYGIRVAAIISAAAGENKLLFNANTPRFLSNIKHVNYGYNTFAPNGTGSPDYGGVWQDGSIPMGYRKNEIGQVEFKGRVRYFNDIYTPGSIPIVAMPSDYQPKIMRYFSVPNVTANTTVLVAVNVAAGLGFMFVHPSTSLNEGDELDLSGIRYSVL